MAFTFGFFLERNRIWQEKVSLSSFFGKVFWKNLFLSFGRLFGNHFLEQGLLVRRILKKLSEAVVDGKNERFCFHLLNMIMSNV